MDSSVNVKNDLVPIEQWICDSCGEVIKKASEGWVEWYREIIAKSEYGNSEYGKNKGFRIVHHDESCMYNSRHLYLDKKLNADLHLDRFIGPNGLVFLLSKIQYEKNEDNSELVEIIRRLHVPYYEEARRYHHTAEENGYFDGEDEVTRYTTGTSRYILNHFKGE